MGTRVVDNTEHHRFELWRDDVRLGEVAYKMSDDVITMIHTEIDPAYGGEGHGSTLATAALDSAREQGLRVNPVCPYIAGYITKHPEYADLLA